MILKEFGGLPGGRCEFAARNSKTIIAHPYSSSIVTCKWSAISQTHSPRVDNWLIPQALALCDNVGSFCRGKKTSERAAAGPPVGKIEGTAGRPHRGAQRISIVAGFNWNPAGG